MMRCLNTKVLLFPLPQVTISTGGIMYPDNYQVGDTANQRFWVAAVGPKVPDLKVGDMVFCPMPAEEHARLDGGARVLDYTHIIAKVEKGGPDETV